VGGHRGACSRVASARVCVCPGRGLLAGVPPLCCLHTHMRMRGHACTPLLRHPCVTRTHTHTPCTHTHT
jgi:hypothetical protein